MSCSYSFSAPTRIQRRSYYRHHPQQKRGGGCRAGCQDHSNVPALLLLCCVLLMLPFSCLGGFLTVSTSSTSTIIGNQRTPAAATASSFLPNTKQSYYSQSSLKSTKKQNDGDDAPWDGQVVSNPTADGQIRGCSLQQVDGTLTEWIVNIDGVEADLGKFGLAVYQKVVSDAKQERFQGFRPGTIPPQLEPTYRTFAMDECARETILEALQQNNIRPFDSCRTDMRLENFCIPPATGKKKKKKKSRKKRQQQEAASGSSDNDNEPEVVEAEPPAWRTFETMKEAIQAGWKPGQSFSFRAVNVQGQIVKDASETEGATPIGGLNF